MEIYFAFVNIGMTELAIIFLIVLVLFGASRIPEVARSIGKGIVEFKKALGGGDSEESKKKNDSEE